MIPSVGVCGSAQTQLAQRRASGHGVRATVCAAVSQCICTMRGGRKRVCVERRAHAQRAIAHVRRGAGYAHIPVRLHAHSTHTHTHTHTRSFPRAAPNSTHPHHDAGARARGARLKPTATGLPTGRPPVAPSLWHTLDASESLDGQPKTARCRACPWPFAPSGPCSARGW